MGQQQLLLLVLGIVIVGIAVVAGIQAFSEGKAKAAQDAAVSDAMRIISDAQAWKLKPGAFGGGGSLAEEDFSGINLKALGYPVASSATTEPYFTINGCYKLAPQGTTGADLTVYADSLSGDCDTDKLIATVTITGADPDDIGWTYN